MQRRQKFAGVAHNDHAGAVDVEVLRGKALNVFGFHGLHVADELIDLIEVYAIDCQRTYLADEAPGCFQATGKTAVQACLARRQFTVRQIARRQFGNFRERQRRNFRPRNVLCRGCRAERSGPTARVERTAGAVTQAALDANLPIQPP